MHHVLTPPDSGHILTAEFLHSILHDFHPVWLSLLGDRRQAKSGTPVVKFLSEPVNRVACISVTKAHQPGKELACRYARPHTDKHHYMYPRGVSHGDRPGSPRRSALCSWPYGAKLMPIMCCEVALGQTPQSSRQAGEWNRQLARFGI